MNYQVCIRRESRGVGVPSVWAVYADGRKLPREFQQQPKAQAYADGYRDGYVTGYVDRDTEAIRERQSDRQEADR